jgi:hypothetical protein
VKPEEVAAELRCARCGRKKGESLAEPLCRKGGGECDFKPTPRHYRRAVAAAAKRGNIRGPMPKKVAPRSGRKGN